MQTLLHNLSRALAEFYPLGEATSIAKLWLSEEVGWDTLLLYTGKDTDLSGEERKKISLFLNRLAQGEPIQYVMGRALFCGNWFAVSSAVLIPRPETEELVREVYTDYSSRSSVSLLDVGTGSGCIALSLSLQMDDAYVEACDISSEALEVAKENNRKLGAKVRFAKVDLREEDCSVLGRSEYDVIVSNPPYVLESEKADMEAHVLQWEPSLALFTPDSDPLLYYRHICRWGQKLLKEEGMIYFEINQQFGAGLVELMSTMGYRDVQLKRDLYGKNRIIKGRR